MTKDKNYKIIIKTSFLDTIHYLNRDQEWKNYYRPDCSDHYEFNDHIEAIKITDHLKDEITRNGWCWDQYFKIVLFYGWNEENKKYSGNVDLIINYKHSAPFQYFT